MNRKEKQRFHVEVADIWGPILTIISIIVAIVTYYRTQTELTTAVIGISYASMAIGCLAGILTLVYKYRYKSLYERKETVLQNALDKCKTELEKEKAEIEKKNAEIARCYTEIEDYKQHVLEQLKVVGASSKSNSILSNYMLVDIAEKGEEQYKTIHDIQELAYDEGTKTEKAHGTLLKFSKELYELFNRYCRNMTAGAYAQIKAYLSIKGIDQDISIAVELLEEPYDPHKNRIEDLKVYTAFRDHKTYTKFRDTPNNVKTREIGKIKYLVKENTDFVQCLSEDECYIVNNALENDHSIKYQPQRGFIDFYNCSMVVPIRIRNSEGGNLFFGFMCCDCKNERGDIEVFDITSAQFLFMCAQNLGTFLETLNSNWVDRIDVGDKYPVDLSKNILQLLRKRICKEN